MSAFVCDNQHFVLLVAGGFAHGLITTREQGSTVGQLLLDANRRAVAARYPDWTEDEMGAEFTLSETTETPLAPIALLVAIDCLDYQCAEAADWPDTAAHRWLAQLRERIYTAHPALGAATWHQPAGQAVPAYTLTDATTAAPTWDFTGPLAAVTSTTTAGGAATAAER